MCWSCRFLFCIIILYQIEFHIAVIFRCAGHLISVFQVRPSLHCVSNYPLTSNFLVFWKIKFLVYTNHDNSNFLNDIHTEYYQCLFTILENIYRFDSKIILVEYFQFINFQLISSLTWSSTNTNFCFPTFLYLQKNASCIIEKLNATILIKTYARLVNCLLTKQNISMNRKAKKILSNALIEWFTHL